VSAPNGASEVAACLASACAACPHVEAAWVSPDGTFIAVQAVVASRRRPDPRHPGWTLVEPVYASAEALRALNAIVQLVRERHPDVWMAHVVSYVFHPGGGWLEVYRRDASDLHDATSGAGR
jgi:hypothetical protein